VHACLTLAGYAERLNAVVGRICAWLTLLMVGLGALNAIVRYLGRFTAENLSSNAYIELQWYLFSAVFLLGAGDALREDAHVRVDVFYSRFSPKLRDIVELAGTLLFLLPFCCFAIVVSLPAIGNSLAVLENSPDPGGLPRYPIKLLIPVCFGLLIVQGLAHALRVSLRLSGRLPREPS
jgi:TRAP-type mannitol/chloroaromatic compound transport system permease small subunit